EVGTEKGHGIARRNGPFLHQPLTRVDDNLSRAEDLTRDVCRARRGAAAALRTRIAVEEILPGELLDIARAERIGLGLEVHRPHRGALAVRARVREVDVDERRDNVQVLRVRQIVEKDQNEKDVRPPKKSLRVLSGEL